jgi:tRNA threonylcarbamoyladenosine biosynthesis protein TsaB
MKLLAIDTSSDACSVAVQVGSEILEKHVIEPRAHTRILLPMIRELLSKAELAPTDLDALVLGNGPGSFIGMRIGASVAQGICYGANLKIAPVSSLAAVAQETMELHKADRVIVAQDARMNEVYVGQFSMIDGIAQLIGQERICAIGPIDSLPDGIVAAGAAWQKYDALVINNKDSIDVIAEVIVPRAKSLLPIGSGVFRAGQAIAPELLLPAYIREKVAEKPMPTDRIVERNK